MALNLTQKQIDNFHSHVASTSNPEECWEWTRGLSKNGYGNIRINKKNYTSSRLAFYLANGYLTDGLFILHSCDNRKCCNPNHLREGTHQENMNDMVSRKRLPARDQKGSANGNATLTEDQVQIIKQLITQGLNNKQIASQFGVTHSMISCIKLGKSWSHI